jgi:hypothetical protein
MYVATGIEDFSGLIEICRQDRQKSEHDLIKALTVSSFASGQRVRDFDRTNYAACVVYNFRPINSFIISFVPP